MNVRINGTSHDLGATSLTIDELLDRVDFDSRRGVAVAVNRVVVPRSEWSTQRVKDGDAVEIVRATQGG